MSAMLRQKYTPQYSNASTGRLGRSLDQDPVSELFEEFDSFTADLLSFDYEEDTSTIDLIMDCLSGSDEQSSLSPEEIQAYMSMPDILPILNSDPPCRPAYTEAAAPALLLGEDEQEDNSCKNIVSDEEEVLSEDDHASVVTSMNEDVSDNGRKTKKKKKKKTPEEIEKAKQEKRVKMVEGGLPCVLQEDDAMLERGEKCRQHAGNKKLLGMVRSCCKRYKVSNKKGKRIIACDIIERFKASGGRFLIREDKYSVWYEVQDKYVYDKLTHTLRDQARGPRSKSAAAKKASSKSPRTSRRNTTSKKRQRQK